MQAKGDSCMYLNPLPDIITILSEILSVIKKITNQLEKLFFKSDQQEQQLALLQIKQYIDNCRQLIQKIEKTQDSECKKLMQRFFSRIIQIITINKHRYIQQSLDPKLVSYCKEQQSVLYEFYRGVAAQFIIQKFLAITNKYIAISKKFGKSDEKIQWKSLKKDDKQSPRRRSNIISKSENKVKKIISNIAKNRQLYNCLDIDQGYFKQSCTQSKTENCQLYEDWIIRNKGINKNINQYQRDYDQYLKKKERRSFIQTQKIMKLASELKNNIIKHHPSTETKRRNLSVVLNETSKVREGFYSDKKFQLRQNNSQISEVLHNEEAYEYISYKQTVNRQDNLKGTKQLSILNAFPQLIVPKWKDALPINKVLINGHCFELLSNKITNRRLINIKQKQQCSIGLKNTGPRKFQTKRKTKTQLLKS